MSGIPFNSKDSGKGVFVDTSSITPLPSSQLLNPYGVHNPHCIRNLRRDVRKNDPKYWHRFTIWNENGLEYSKNFILKVIMDFVYPCELYPVYVSHKGTKTFFLARNCLDSVIKLCEFHLSVPNPGEPDSPFKVSIVKDALTINHVPVLDLESNIVQVLQKRLTNVTINLSKFYKDEDLREYCTLGLPSFLLYVLSLVANLKTLSKIKVSQIILSNNDIKHLPDLKTINTRGFKSIDLSNNMIQSIEDIVPLKDLPDLIFLNLEGNPLCRRFDSGFTYFLYAKTICRKLTTLDNTELITNGLYKPHKTFLCDTNGFDVTNQFLEQYFTAFDQQNRPTIDLFYSENAMFSMTYRELGSCSRRSREFRDLTRNLLNSSNKEYDEMCICYGKRQIGDRLRGLPNTRHHSPTFTVDLMLHSKRLAVLSISGLFQHIHVFTCGFIRSFVLSSENGKEWMITNDMFHVYAPFNKSSKFPWPKKALNSFPYPTTLENKCSLARTFECITGMHYMHSNNFLEQNNWNLELSLRVFIEKYINDEIPNEVLKEKRTEQTEETEDEAVLVTEDDNLPPIETLVIEKPIA